MRVEIEPGVRLFVDIDGASHVPAGPVMQERPTLILVHGGPGFDHSAFKPFFARFTDQVQVLYLDQRGHGRSDARPPSEWNLDTHADDLVRLCQVLGIERPIVLGQSFGGFVVQRYLARHPTHPRAVVLSSTAARYNLDGKVQGFARRGGPEAGAAAQAFWADPNAATWATYDRLCRHLYNTTPQDADGRQRMHFRPEILFASAGGEQQEMDLRPGLAAVQCPVLLMAGDEDPVTPMEDAELIFDALPKPWREIVRFNGVGHGPWRDDPVGTERVLRAWLSAQLTR